MAIRSSWSENSERYVESGSVRNFPSFYGVLGFFVLSAYGAFWVIKIAPYWFNSFWTSRAVLPEQALFHNIPGGITFTDDPVRSLTAEFLPVMHLWLGQILTRLCGDPIMSGHWIMLLQILAALLAVFYGMRARSGAFPGIIAIIWILICRPLAASFTSGSFHGWEVTCAALYLFSSAFRGGALSLFVILLSALLAPWHLAPVLLVTEIFYMSWKIIRKRSRSVSIRQMKFLLLVLPGFIILFGLQYYSRFFSKPVLSYEQGLKMEDLSKEGGVYPLLPFETWQNDLSRATESILTSGQYAGPGFLKDRLIKGIFLSVAFLTAIGMMRRKSLCGAELWSLIAASTLCYFTARYFALFLGPPDIFIEKLVPLALIMIISQGIWRTLYLGSNPFHVSNSLAQFWARELFGRSLCVVALGVLILTVVICGGSGLNNRLNFDYLAGQEGLAHDWLKKNTILNSVVIGDPRNLEGIGLLAGRIPYVTEQSLIPWTAAYGELSERSRAALQVAYARDAAAFSAALKNIKADFVILKHADYEIPGPDGLAARKPCSGLMKELAAAAGGRWFFHEIIAKDGGPFIVFRDSVSILVDIKKFQRYMEEQASRGDVASGRAFG